MVEALHQFDYLFALVMLFAFLDAWNIGANDVANSFASSVSSRALKYWQAMVLAAICEFLGAVLAGSRVSDTIRRRVVDLDAFENDPAMLMLLMACALIGSSLWLSLATSIGMPVSSTHSIIGGVIGSAIGIIGAEHVHWGWSGFSQIVASWFISPAIAGCFASIIFLSTKYLALERKHDVRNALMMVPVCVFFTFSILTMMIVWDGAPNLHLDDLSGGAIAASVLGVGAAATILYLLTVHPYFRRKVIYNDWTLKWYHIFIGFKFWFAPTDNIPPMPEGHELTIDYYQGRRPTDVPSNSAASHTSSSGKQVDQDEEVVIDKTELASNDGGVWSTVVNLEKQEMTTRQLWWSLAKHPSQWNLLLVAMFRHVFFQDVISSQVTSNDALGKGVSDIHQRSKFYNNKVEYLFSLLQAITAGTMSFAHGSNDISNAAGPLASVYLVWTSNATAAQAEVPIWILCFTAGALVIGLLMYGYRIMHQLGNRLILQSPSRGFSIELGTAITTVFATQLAVPVSTTQCAVGATVFVGLCNNRSLKTVNWKVVAWCYLGWLVTLPCAGLIAGILAAIIRYAPNFGETYQLTSS